MWTEEIQDQTAHSVHSDLDLHCPQKLLMWSTAGKELLPDHGSRVFSFCCNVESAIHLWILHHKSMMYSPCQAIKAFQNIVPNIGIPSFPFFHGFFPFNPLPHNTASRYLAAENIVRNGEIACTYMVLIFQNKPWFLLVCSTSLLKTLWEKQKLLVKSNFSFSHSVFYPSRELSAIFIKFEIVVCNLF